MFYYIFLFSDSVVTLKNGAGIDLQTIEGYTALHGAGQEGHADTVRLLLEKVCRLIKKKLKEKQIKRKSEILGLGFRVDDFGSRV